MQTDELVASATVLNVPAGQRSQIDWSSDTNSPGTHDVQVLEPAGAAEPDAQSWHSAIESAPTVVLNVPAGHGTHAESVGFA